MRSRRAQLLETASYGFICLAALASMFTISVMQSALGLAFLLWLTRRLTAKEASDVDFPLWRPIGAFLLVSLVSALGAADSKHAWEASGEAVVPLVIWLIAAHVNRPSRLRGLMNTWLVAGLLAAAYGLYQIAQLGSEVRVSGTLSHYMSYSGLLMMCALVALGRTLFPSTANERRIAALAGIVMAAALAMTQTRSAWIGAGVGALYLLWIKEKRLVLLLPVVLVPAYFVGPASVQKRVDSMFDLSDVTWVHRQALWQGGLDVIRDYPWLGVGPDNLRGVFPDYVEHEVLEPSGQKFAHLHNNVLQIAAERGLTGLAAWTWIWVAFFIFAWRTRPRPTSSVAAPDEDTPVGILHGALAGLIAFQAAGIFEYNFGDSEVVTGAYILMAVPIAWVSRR